MKTLKVARGLELPVDVAGEAIAILAKRGAGKTNTATVLVEELHAAGVQIVILDPVGAWWGIRSSADGQSEGLPFAILGGEHGDVPLEQTAGALVADVVVDTGQSLLLDLSDFPSKASSARFVVDFAERLFRRKARQRSLLHLVLEEADTFAPQKVRSDDARMAGAIEQIVRRGRSRGLGLTMVTQRSAVLNKDVLSQADVLVAMRTTSPNDQKAVRAWIDVHGEDDDQVLASLTSLETGEAWVWNPERSLLERVKIRRRRTFDSSATPKAGERRAEPKRAAAIDLQQLGAEIAATAERARENDPAELRKRIRELERRAAAPSPVEPERVVETVVDRVEVPVVAGEQVESLRAAARDLKDVAAAVGEHADGIVRALARVGSQEAPRAEPVERREEARPAAGPAATRPPARRPAPPAVQTDVRVSAPQQRILDALAALEAIGVTEAAKVQLALFAEASPKSSSYSNNLGHLNSQLGLIRYPRPGYVALTAEGRELASATHAPSTAAELQEYAYRLVGGPKARLLRELVDAYPEALTKQELADRAGASPTSSSFSNNLGSLRSLGLIDYPSPGYVAALPILFLEP